jgi:hypothetical protein
MTDKEKLRKRYEKSLEKLQAKCGHPNSEFCFSQDEYSGGKKGKLGKSIEVYSCRNCGEITKIVNRMAF